MAGVKKQAAALLLTLLLAGCGAEATPAEGITREEAEQLVEQRLMESSQKLCPNPQAAGLLRQSEFACQGEVTVEDRLCWQVAGGGSTFAITRDGAHLYEWQPVTGSYAIIE